MSDDGLQSEFTARRFKNTLLIRQRIDYVRAELVEARSSFDAPKATGPCPPAGQAQDERISWSFSAIPSQKPARPTRRKSLPDLSRARPQRRQRRLRQAAGEWLTMQQSAYVVLDQLVTMRQDSANELTVACSPQSSR